MRTVCSTPLFRTAGAAMTVALSVFSASVMSQSCGDAEVPGPACTQQPTEQWEPDWKEQRTDLPPLPESDNLVPIDASGDPRYSYYVDKASISRGSDNVMRYTVIVESSTGARNIFHEGLRCETDEVRTYAYATSTGTFSRSSTSSWRPLARRGVRAYQEFLANVIVCNKQGYAWDAERAVAALGRQYTSGGVRIESFCQSCDESWDSRRND